MVQPISLLFILLQTIVCQNLTGFNYFQGGDDWAQTYPMCKGTGSSPIPIPKLNGTAPVLSYPIDFVINSNVNAIGYVIGNSVSSNGLFSMVNLTKAITCTSADCLNRQVVYVSKNIQIHAPSEHTIDGVAGDAELQIVHKITQTWKQAPDYVILSLLFKKSVGASDPLIAGWNVNTTVGATTQFNMTASALGHFLSNPTYYAYFGTFTTPPCLSPVFYVVNNKLFDISDSQLSVFQNLFANNKTFAGGRGNNRKVQSLNIGGPGYYNQFPPGFISTADLNQLLNIPVTTATNITVNESSNGTTQSTGSAAMFTGLLVLLSFYIL